MDFLFGGLDEPKEFRKAIIFLGLVVAGLTLYNTWLSIKVNKMEIEDKQLERELRQHETI